MSFLRVMHTWLIGETLDRSVSGNTTTFNVSDPILIEQITVIYTASATVGSRTVALRIFDATDTLVVQMAGDVAQLLSTQRAYIFARSVPPDAGFVGNVLQRPLPVYRVEPGWKVRVLDTAGVSTADTFRVFGTIRRVTSL